MEALYWLHFGKFDEGFVSDVLILCGLPERLLLYRLILPDFIN